MAELLVEPGVLADYWRPLTEAENVVAFGLLKVASALIRRRIPDIDARIADGRMDPDILGYVVTEMIRSAVEAAGRQSGVKSESNTMGPYSWQVTYDAASHMAFTGDLFAMLIGEAPATVGTAKLGAAQVPSLPDWSCYPVRTWPVRPGWHPV